MPRDVRDAVFSQSIFSSVQRIHNSRMFYLSMLGSLWFTAIVLTVICYNDMITNIGFPKKTMYLSGYIISREDVRLKVTRRTLLESPKLYWSHHKTCPPQPRMVPLSCHFTWRRASDATTFVRSQADMPPGFRFYRYSLHRAFRLQLE